MVDLVAVIPIRREDEVLGVSKRGPYEPNLGDNSKKQYYNIYKLLFEGVILLYECVGKLLVEKGELDATKSKELTTKLGIKISLTITQNRELDRNVEWGYILTVKEFVKVFKGKLVGEWP